MSTLSNEQILPADGMPNICAAKRRLPLLWCVVCLLPAFWTLYMILHWGVDTPYWDQWILAYILDAAAKHQITFAALTLQTNESRFLFPRLWALFTTRFGHWNQFADMLAALAVSCLTALQLLRLAVDTCRRSQTTLVAALLGSALIFSWVQYEAWLWGVGLALVIPPCCLYCGWAICVGNCRYAIRVVLCALLAFVAQYSFSDGIFLWILLSPVILVGDGGSEKIPRIAATIFWILSAAASCAIYFHNYIPIDPWTVAGIWQNRVGEIEYILAVLGSPFQSQDGTVRQAMCFGAMQLLVFVAACSVLLFSRNRAVHLWRALPWFTIAIFALLCASAAGVLRIRLGLGEALAPRYAVTEAHFAIGTIFLLLLASRELQARWSGRALPIAAATPLLLAAGAGAMALLLITANLNTPSHAALFHQLQLHSKTAVQFAQILPDSDTEHAFIWAEGVHDLQFLTDMDREGYLWPHLLTDETFAQLVTQSQHTAAESSNMDGSLDGAQRLPNGDIYLHGWSWDKRTDTSVPAVIFTYRGTDRQEHPLAMALEYGLGRGDVAEAFGDPARIPSGWARRLHVVGPAMNGPLVITAWVYDPTDCRLWPLPHILTAPATSSVY
jgi:hypothetical protein